MQVSELYRRGIFHPVGERSKRELLSWHVEKPIQVRLLTLPDDESFEKLVDIDLFAEINGHIGCYLGDYEEESIAPDRLHELDKIVQRFRNAHRRDPLAACLLADLHDIVQSAIRENAPVFFVL